MFQRPEAVVMPQAQRQEEPLREKILKVLPKTQISMNTSVGDLIEANQLLVQYFMQAELKAPKQSEMAVQTETQVEKEEPSEASESSEKENELKGQRVMLITACPHSHRKHYAKVSVFFLKIHFRICVLLVTGNTEGTKMLGPVPTLTDSSTLRESVRLATCLITTK